jgi:hypothetical protein
VRVRDRRGSCDAHDGKRAGPKPDD